MKKNKGFTLVELMISMVIVAIAMLGFAALMAISAKTTQTNTSKSTGTATIQSFAKVIQNSRDAIQKVVNGAQPVVIEVLADGTSNASVFSANNTSLENLLTDIQANLGNMPKVQNAGFRMTIQRNEVADAGVFVYNVQMTLIYQPNGERGGDNVDALNLPGDFVLCGNTAQNIKDRNDRNVICNSLGMRL